MINFRQALFEKYQNYGYDLGSFVPLNKNFYVELCNDCSRKFNDDYHIENIDRLFAKEGQRLDNEEVYVMFDRDFNELWFNDEMYNNCLKECDKYRYHPLVTTPQFELWLLMHFENADLSPKYDSHYKFHIQKELEKFDPIARSQRLKDIDDDRFELYQDNIKQAITTSESQLFESDPKTLIDHAGTNIGGFIKSLMIDP